MYKFGDISSKPVDLCRHSLPQFFEKAFEKIRADDIFQKLSRLFQNLLRIFQNISQIFQNLLGIPSENVLKPIGKRCRTHFPNI